MVREKKPVSINLLELALEIEYCSYGVCKTLAKSELKWLLLTPTQYFRPFCRQQH